MPFNPRERLEGVQLPTIDEVAAVIDDQQALDNVDDRYMYLQFSLPPNAFVMAAAPANHNAQVMKRLHVPECSIEMIGRRGKRRLQYSMTGYTGEEVTRCQKEHHQE